MRKDSKHSTPKTTHSDAPNTANSGIFYWLGAAGIALFAATVIYLMRQQGLTTTTHTTSPYVPAMTRPEWDTFSTPCVTPTWTMIQQPVSKFHRLLRLEHPPHDLYNKDLTLRLDNAAEKFMTFLTKMKADPVCQADFCAYIDHVLNSPDFKIVIHSEELRSYAVYRPTAHEIRIPLDTIEENNTHDRLIRTLLHEFWHAHKVLVHQDGGVFDTQKRGLAYNIESDNPQDRKRALKYAIDQGDHRVLHELSDLKGKHAKNRLSAKEKTTWQQYSDVIEKYYHPNRQEGMINQENFKKIEPALIKNIEKNGFYAHQFPRSGQTLTSYVNAYKPLSDGGAILYGYTGQDKISAFIEDTRWSKYNSAHTHRKVAYNPVGSAAEAEFMERDAEIAENGSAINKVFYPERQLFHDRCDHGKNVKVKNNIQ